MGTTYRVEIPALPDTLAADEIRADVDRILTETEQQMSTYRPDSEVSLFNTSTSTSWFPVSSATERVVAEALRVARLSSGALDITVGPLVELWGFGAGPKARRRPSPEALESARARVGIEHLHARESPAALRKDRPDLAIDLSAIAKGFAVDRLAEHLSRAGIADYLVEIGGELRGRGHSSRGRAWTVAIEQPDRDGTMASTIIRLGDEAIATSGVYRSYFDEEGERYAHLIDPRTGTPVRHHLASVSVVAPTAMRADALATALLVLGPEHSRRLADREGLAALFVLRQGTALRTTRTASFEEREFRRTE